MSEINKNIDENWKDAAEKQKEALKKEGKFLPPEPDFSFFITTLSLQAAVDLGQVPNPERMGRPAPVKDGSNPATNKKERNLTQAKFIIDTLGMLKDKTKGNLTPEESGLLDNMLYELRMQYIQAMDALKGNIQQG